MNYLTLTDTPQPDYPIVYLVPTIRKEEVKKEYVDAFNIPHDDVLFMSLYYSQNKKKTPAGEMREYITKELVPALTDLSAKYLVVTDSEYFKILTKKLKADAYLGYVLDCAFGPWKVVYVPNYRAIFYDPLKTRAKIKQGIDALLSHVSGNYVEPGGSIIHFEEYPRTNQEIKQWLDKLLEMDCDLTIDIETFNLKHHTAGIGTITFCWNKHEGIAFPIDYEEITKATQAPYGKQVINNTVRVLLIYFFRNFKRKAIYHNISYDAYILIYQLFMVNILDTEGLLYGLDTMLANWDDTKLISYLATNSCAGNKLSLKDQAQAYAGNYAQEEIKDITRIPVDQLLKYNLIDGLSTWFVHEKHRNTVIIDQQENIYQTLFKPAIVDIIQMQLTGLPINMVRVGEVKALLRADESKAIDTIRQSKVVQRFTHQLNENWVNHKNTTLKKKRVTLNDAKEVFNPNSGPQLQELLFSMLALPVLSFTDSKQPSVDKDSLKALLNHTSDQSIKDFLNAMLDYSAVNKILNSFIPAMEDAVLGPDGWHYLCGNFNLGGTVSGRLSSSDPNLQNLPATGSKYAKLIKSCFQAPPGWLLCGLDFASLEDRISAVTTKDPNKIKVYTDGYDGHSLRAYAYYKEQLPGIVDTVTSINSIQTLYKTFRQDSKEPTFLLTYGGSYMGLMKNCGFPLDKAKLIEKRYHELYWVSDAWVAAKLDQASKDGYITAAFGLRVRTPLLKQVIRGTSKTPYEAEAESRTAGNALGQSWCLLNTRASAEFMSKVRNSKYRLDIRPCAHIHDAQYMLVRDCMDAVMYANKHLVEAISWQDHSDIYHDDVKLGGELSIFWPDWTSEITIPNQATEIQIRNIIEVTLPAS